MEELCRQLYESAYQTVAFFRGQLQADGSYRNSQKSDLENYFKVPMLFLVAGQEYKFSAHIMLDYIQGKCLSANGDLMTDVTNSLRTDNPVYSELYPWYMNGWIAMAALKAKKAELATQANKYIIENFYDANTGRFLTCERISDGKEKETDIFLWAHGGLLFLQQGKMKEAIRLGENLCVMLERQPDPNNYFYLRLNKNNQIVTDYPSDKALFYRIDKNADDQLYFMLGYPIDYLVELYQETKNEKFLEAAKKYFEFAASCKGVLKSNNSHKIAWAAAALYSVETDPKEKEKYWKVIEPIAQHFLALLSANDVFAENYDQRPEVARWFLEIVRRVLSEEKVQNIMRGITEPRLTNRSLPPVSESSTVEDMDVKREDIDIKHYSPPI